MQHYYNLKLASHQWEMSGCCVLLLIFSEYILSTNVFAYNGKLCYLNLPVLLLDSSWLARLEKQAVVFFFSLLVDLCHSLISSCLSSLFFWSPSLGVIRLLFVRNRYVYISFKLWECPVHWLIHDTRGILLRCLNGTLYLLFDIVSCSWRAPTEPFFISPRVVFFADWQQLLLHQLLSYPGYLTGWCRCLSDVCSLWWHCCSVH